tara:strand:- start:9249 stop:9608 length:360 start_codon:yes stop_codon:yes gene_type:complete
MSNGKSLTIQGVNMPVIADSVILTPAKVINKPVVLQDGPVSFQRDYTSAFDKIEFKISYADSNLGKEALEDAGLLDSKGRGTDLVFKVEYDGVTYLNFAIEDIGTFQYNQETTITICGN